VQRLNASAGITGNPSNREADTALVEGKAHGQAESIIENVQRSISAIRNSIISRVEAYPSLKTTLDAVRTAHILFPHLLLRRLLVLSVCSLVQIGTD
jgi:hypothetical protein